MPQVVLSVASVPRCGLLLHQLVSELTLPLQPLLLRPLVSLVSLPNRLSPVQILGFLRQLLP
jgi:hypothetical protein